MIPAKAFLPTTSPSHAAIIGLTTAVVYPLLVQPGLSAHTSSKLAVVKIMDYIAAEALSVFAAALSPGMIHTAIIDKLGIDAATLPFDSVGLPANFMVWLTSPEASLNGRYVYANWDVAELKARAEEIKSGAILTPGVTGWPFAPA